MHLLNQLCQIAVRLPKLRKYLQKTFTEAYQVSLCTGVALFARRKRRGEAVMGGQEGTGRRERERKQRLQLICA